MKTAKKNFKEVMEENLMTNLPPLRCSVKSKEILEKEAKFYGHTTSGYIRWLIQIARENLELPNIDE